MKKLIALVLILALPTLAFGATNYTVQVASASSASYEVGSVPNDLNMDVILTLDETGVFGFFGALDGQGSIASRGFSATVGTWGYRVNEDAGYVGQPLSALKEFGAIEIAGNQPVLASGANTLMTLGVTGLAGLPVGVYNFTVVSSSDLGAGAAWGDASGSPVLVDSSTPFVLTVTPEPATMLLLALALPFLRRRSA